MEKVTFLNSDVLPALRNTEFRTRFSHPIIFLLVVLPALCNTEFRTRFSHPIIFLLVMCYLLYVTQSFVRGSVTPLFSY